MAKKQSSPVPTFSAAELVAIAGLVKEDKVTAAKRSLADGYSASVDFTIHITGAIQKGLSTKPGTFEHDATVELGAPHVFAALRKMGIGKARFAKALAAVALDVPFDAEFGEVVNAEQAARAAKLPKVTGTTAGRSGAVQSQVSATRCKAPPAQP